MGAAPWRILTLLLCLRSTLCYTDPYQNQPKLLTDNGHLEIVAAADKNITLRTSGRGYVNLNSENLLQIASMARRASDFVVLFQRNLETNIQNRLNSLSRQISGPRGLTAKMAVLEQAISSGNVSSSGSPSASIGEPTRPGFGIRLNRLRNRIRSVEVQLRNLRNLLTIDECLSNPCRNGATCQDLFNGFMCICPDNWQGELCDQDVNECAMFVGTELGCRNGATCINKPGSYECVCADGWFGLHCTLRVNDCTATDSKQLCGNGVCVNQGGTGRGYTCICDEGWTRDLSNSCTVDIDECQAKRYPCSHDPLVQCINLPGSYHCGFCPPGYTGNGFQCTDINECETNNGGCSLVPRVSCHNTKGSRICGQCPPGYSGDGVICTPVVGGRCAVNNGGCFPSAHCFENAGIVNCMCPNGFAGDGYGPNGCSPSSQAVHPCLSNPCKNGGTCVPRGTQAVCVCHPHLTGADCSVVVFASCSPNPCLNNGTCSVAVYERVQQVRCSCAPGYEGERCATLSSDCGGMFYQDTGELQVPSGTTVQRYPDGKRCTWRIEVSSNKVAEISFSELDIKFSESCEKNYIKIIQPVFTNPVTRFCRSGMPPKITTLSNVFKVELFTTGSDTVHFKLNWKTADTACGGEVEAQSHGTIESPGYPHGYPASQDCEWKVFAPPGKRIQFLFSNIDLEPSADCSKDYLKIQEYNDEEPSNMLAQFCNSSSPAAVTTHHSAAYVYFHSDQAGTARGFRITYTLLDGCGGVLTAGKGDITPPMGSNHRYMSEQDCEWRIQMPLGDKIKIVFNSFDLEEREECDDYVEVRDGPSSSSPLVGQWCGSTVPPPYTSSSNALTVIFHSDFVINGDGFEIHYETICGGEFTGREGEIRSPNYPQPYSAERECVYVISAPPSTAIRLHFQDFELESLGSSCDYDYLEVRDGDNANSTVIGTYCGSVLPADILSTHNYLYITFTADASYQHRGFLANYSTIDLICGGILKQHTGLISSPQTEEGYPPGATCRWVISAPRGWVVQLGFLAFHLEYSRECSLDAVEIYENNTDTGNSALLDRHCGLKIPPTIVTTTNLVTVVFRSDDSVHREGFTANYVMIDKRKVCGGTIHSISGSIETPNYPEDYPDNKECTWIIHVPQGRQIRLKFETFNIEGNSHDCSYDSLTIRNGLQETSPLVGKYCGTVAPPDVTSLTNGLWVHFSSDRSGTFQGFRATWDAATTGCGGTLTSSSGTITSPNYPQPYAKFAECFFKISVAQGSKVVLTIIDLDLEPHSKCQLDYIEVFDGFDDRSKSLGRFCKSTHPTNVLASANQMFIKFVSDISYGGRGFHLKYNTECNITLHGHHGVVESPNYPGKYLPNLNCMWLIQAPMGNKINISFVHLELEPSIRPFALPGDRKTDDCKYDFVEILEGTQNRTPTTNLGKFCGEDKPPLISSSLDQVYVHFVTDHMLERHGFYLEWAVHGCGGVFQDRPTGTFTSPGWPNGYPMDVQCEWKISAPWGKSLEITVTEVHLENLNNCGNDYIAIYGGEDETSPLLMKACHQSTSPATVTTSSNHAFVKFQSDFSISGKGFSATWRFVDSKCGGRFTTPFGSIHSHNYPKNYENHDDCEWLIQVPENHLINLTFTDFDVEPSSNNLTTDYVNVYDGRTLDAPLLLSHSGNALPTPAYVISTGNSLLVRHKADGSLTAKGFSAQYSLACGARISAKGSGTFSLDHTVSATHPWRSEDSENCTWYLVAEDPADKIRLTFTFLDTSPNTENSQEECSYNYVAVHDGDDTNATIILRQCGTKVPLPVISSGGALTVQAVSLSNGGPLGTFAAMWSTVSTACGGELTSEQGVIASPNWPDGYPPNVDCEWTLTASPGNRVTLTFLKFDLEESEFCNGDYVELREGSSDGPMLGVFCGSQVPDNITNSASTLWVGFRSDSANTAKGFLAEYSLVHGMELAGLEGHITSPMYPRPFIQEGEFKWRITVPNNKVVRITFSDFYMDKYMSSDEICYRGALQVFDGADETAPKLLEACGPALPAPVTSTGNVATVQLENNPWHRGSQWKLKWEAAAPAAEVKNTTVEDLGKVKLVHLSPANNSATITSPDHPQPYKPDLSLDWVVDTSPGFHIALKFTAFDLEHFDECEEDNVVVYTESSEAGEWKALSPNLCLPNTTETTFVAGRKMKIHFETDHSIQKTGFSAKVTAECGGVLTEPNGILDTSSLKANITTNKITCEWEIRVRSGRTIQFTFSKFDLPKLGQDSCITNYIMIRNGGYKDSPPLGETKYCGNVAPLLPVTSSNRAFISYTARPGTPGVILQYTEVDYDCHHEIKLDSQKNFTISSPNYPQPPSSPHITCTWIVTAPAGEAVTLDFVNRFDLKFAQGEVVNTFLPKCIICLEDYKDHKADKQVLKPATYRQRCTVEYIEIHDGGTELSPSLGKWCTLTPPSQTTRGNRMYIKYFTDTDTPNNGFSAVVRIATCGGTFFDQNKVTLQSPKYPSSYPPDLDCTWRIVGMSPDFQLRFNVTELLLGDEEVDDCDNSVMDYIEVVNVNPLFLQQRGSDREPESETEPENPEPTKLCGRHRTISNGTALIPPSSSNEVYVRFHSGHRSPGVYNLPRKFAMTVTVHRQRCYQEINAESGVITSPGYPSPVPRHTYLFCSWVITVPEGRRVSLKILDFDLEPKGVNQWNEFKVSLYSGGIFMSALSTDSVIIGKTINSFGNKLRVNYYEDSVSGAHRGMKAEFSSVLSEACGGTLGDSGEVRFDAAARNYSYYYCEWTHARAADDAPATFTVTIAGVLNSPDSAEAALPHYTSGVDQLLIQTQSGYNTFYSLQLNEAIKSPIVVRNPFQKITISAKKRTPYQWLNREIPASKANFSISFKTDACGGWLNASDQYIESPGYPSGYAANLDCAWLVKLQPGSQIKVEFVALDLDMDCKKDFIHLYNGLSQSSPMLTEPLCGNTRPALLKTQEHAMFVEFHSGPVKTTHTGFRIKVSADITGCGGIIHQKEGILESPNYGEKDYPNNTECEWTVILPSGSYAIISFTGRFNVEQSADCKNDFVQVFDWSQDKWQQMGGNICGRSSLPLLKSSGNKFRVLFRTNPSITGEGFQLKWKDACGGIIQVEGNGSIVSPNYPKTYFGDLTCNYTLIAPSMRSIYGKFEDFAVEKAYAEGEPCRFDNVTVTSYSVIPDYFSFLAARFRLQHPWAMRTLRPMEAVYCGSQPPEPVYSFNRLELLFKSDRFVGYKGFLFTYSLVDCGGNITSPTIIKNPSDAHLAMRKCTWYISAPPDKVVVFKMKHFKGRYLNCATYGLRVYDGHNITAGNSSTLIDTFCGNFWYMPKKLRLVSSGNKMAVQYVSEVYIPIEFEAAIGFTYGEKQKCGGTVRLGEVALPHTLQAPDVDRDGRYEPLLSCDWLLLAPDAHQVRLTFNSLDVQNCTAGNETCSCDGVEIHDGDSETSPVMQRYCGKVAEPNVLTSSTGSLFVHFFSDGATQLSGFQISVTSLASPCGPTIRNATAETQTLESPRFAGDANQQCLWQIHTPRGEGILTLRVTHLNLPPPCIYNQVNIVEKIMLPRSIESFIRSPSRESRTVGTPVKLCGNRTMELTMSTRVVQIQYSSNRAGPDTGFRLEYRMKKDCDGNYTAPYGRVAAISALQHSESCHHLIHSSQPNVTIALYFNAFVCFGDRALKIYDGPNEQAQEVASYCARRRPNPVFSTGPSLYLVFNNFNRVSMYEITYTTTDQGRGCGGRLSDIQGVFTSPLYPLPYKKDSACRWDVSVPHGSKIYFNFIFFDVGPTATCTTNYIQFYDVDTKTGLETVHSRYCGEEKPAEVEMTGDTAVVRYFTTTHNNGTGWVLQWATQPRASDHGFSRFYT